MEGVGTLVDQGPGIWCHNGTRTQCDPTPSRLEAERGLGSSTFASACTLPRGPHRGDGCIFDTDVVLQDGIGRI